MKTPSNDQVAKKYERQDREFLFSIVTAAFNVSPWMNDYFKSIIQQSINFSEHIQIVFVDDGSTDDTFKMAKIWEAQFPENIICLSKENGGPASARNFGLPYAKGKWVTFIDPNDFVNETYFVTVKNFIDKIDFEVGVISANPIFYNGIHNTYHNNHPLAYKYRSKETVVNLLSNPEYIQLEINSCFLRSDYLKKYDIEFNEIFGHPSEDAYFINQYLLKSKCFTVAYLQSPLYFLRMGMSSNHFDDMALNELKNFNKQIFYAYIDIFNHYMKQIGTIPDFLQNAAIYVSDIFFKDTVRQNLTSSSSKELANSFIDILKAVFCYITPKNIFFSSLNSVSLQSRVMMLNALKGIDLAETPLTVVEVSSSEDSIAVVHYSGSVKKISVERNDISCIPKWSKVINHVLHGLSLCIEQRLWFSMDNDSKYSFYVDGKPVAVVSGAKTFKSVDINDILKSFYLSAKMLPKSIVELIEEAKDLTGNKYSDCWLLMDRVNKADDNAEHFYRWLTSKPDAVHNLFYIIDEKSQDWARLVNEGFRVIPYGSKEHYFALFNAKWLISSHIDKEVIDLFGIRNNFGLPKYKVAHLKHGIVKDEISKWVNTKRIDCFLTCSQKEYSSILNGPSKFSERELVLTGFPRHDALYRKGKNTMPGRAILLCPTWRKHLRYKKSHEKGLNSEATHKFRISDYYNAWNTLVKSERLSRIAKKYRYKLLFLSHPEMARYRHLFENTGNFIFLNNQNIKSIQDLIANCSLLITDYSSLAFEAAFINRAVAYFHFKENPSIFESHVYSKGYFDYEVDGFGPVIIDVSSMEDYLCMAMEKGCSMSDFFKERAASFFTFRDSNNCQRVYDAILSRT